MSLALAAGASGAHGAAHEHGRLPLANHSPEEYGGHQQNWDLMVDRQGLLWVANTDGLLQYDGSRWRYVDDPLGRRVWSIAESADGALWFGASGDFGCLAPGERGTYRWVSLLDRLPPGQREMGDVRQILATPAGVFFRARNQLVRWQPEASPDQGVAEIWSAPLELDQRGDAFDRMAWLGGRLVVGRRTVGLQELREGRFVTLPGSEELIDEAAMGALELDSDTLLVAGFRRGLFVGGERLEAWDTPVGRFAREHLVMGLTRLADGRFALSSFRGGLAIFDRGGEVLRVVDKAAGLRHNELMGAGVQDRNRGLWLPLNNGLARIDVGSPLERFDELEGLEGSVLALRRFEGRLYVGTSLGTHRFEPAGRDGGAARFVALPGARRECWALRSMGDELWAATSDGLFNLSRDSESVYDSIAFDVAEVGGQRLIATWRLGLLVEAKGGPGAGRFRVEQSANDVRMLVLGDGDWLWMRSIGPNRRERIERLDLSRPLEATSPVRAYGSREGLPEEQELAPFLWRGTLWVGAESGLFRYDREIDRFESVGLTDDTGEPLAAIAPAVDGRGRLWISGGKHQVSRIEPAADGGLRVTAPMPPGGMRDVRIFHPEANGSVVWAGSGDGRLVRWRQPAEQPAEQPAPPQARTLIRTVRLARPGGGLVFGGAAPAPDEPPLLEWADNSLRIEFAMPGSGDPAGVRYRSRLSGLDEAWSDWSPEPFREFTGLWEGQYRFEVVGRGPSGAAGEPAAFSFRVRPPAYRTWWAYLAYLAATALAVYGLVRWRLLSAARRVDRLRLEVHRRRSIQAELEERNAEMERYVYTVSHDLKSPLITMRGFLDLLEKDLEGQSQERVRADAAQIRKATEHMYNLVRDQLELARVGRVADPPESVSMSDLGTEAVAASGQLDGIEVVIQPDMPIVHVDRRRVVEALQNLLENAARFMGDQPRPRIEIGVRPGPAPEFFVRDNGIGIERGHLERVFELFRRLDPTGGGTGVGLAIVRRIVEVNGGRIWAESEGPGHGTTFCFTLASAPPEGATVEAGRSGRG